MVYRCRGGAGFDGRRQYLSRTKRFRSGSREFGPWLAGMPPGSADPSGGGTAPGNSPAQVMGLPLTSIGTLSFAASGNVANGGCGAPYCPSYGPEGGPYPSGTNLSLDHDTGDDNGISNLIAPINALVGVFLSDAVPSSNPPPATLDFSTQESRDYTLLSPALQQTFYIGDGVTSMGAIQQINVPAGATRLFLGTMDGCCWYDNQGSFSVLVREGSQISPVPEPPATLLLAIGMGALLTRGVGRHRGGKR